MSGNGASNITQVLKVFQKFLSVYENPLWTRTVTADEAKDIFKIGHSIEQTTQTFETKNIFNSFLILLEKWGAQNELHYTNYKSDFFALANDHLLRKFFTDPKIKETNIDLGIRIYTSLYPKERFKKCIESLILTCCSLKSISSFVNKSIPDKNIIQCNLILTRWSGYFKNKRLHLLEKELQSYTSMYNVQKYLPHLISIIALHEPVLDEAKYIKGHIIENILPKMVDRSRLTKEFWLSLFRNVNLEHMSKVCENYPMFFESLIDFINYVGNMMIKECDSNDWTVKDPGSIFGDLTYYDLVLVLKTLCCNTMFKSKVMEKFEQTKSSQNHEFWDQVLNDVISD